jgi:prephenate dehydrogenase
MANRKRQDIQIGIIGGTGGMGRIFADLFRQEGYRVHVSGRTRGPDIPTMADACQVVIVSVPIGITREVIEQLGPHMKEDALLMDLTSLKTEPVKAMLQSSPAEVIGLHPLFGPGVASLSGYTIVICLARGKSWIAWVKDIFTKQGAILIETTPERHDEVMALVQALNHLNSITLGMMLQQWGIDLAELRKYATPIFHTKLDIIKEIFTNNPRLYAEIIALSPHIQKILDLYGKTLADLKSVIDKKDTEALTRLIRERDIGKS